ncbi:hypothetical protein [Methanococcus sp. CF]
MYQNLPEKDLVKLFDEYIASEDYKKRVEAAKILGFLSEDEIEERIQKIVLLNSDLNIAVLLNLLSSIKSVILKYPKKTEELLIHVYINTEFSNHLVSEFSRQIIDSINPKVIDNIVVKYTSKLYSKNNFEVARALLVLGFVSIHSPKYLKNSLPELSMISLHSNSELLKILAQAILDGFENIPKLIIKDLKFLIESPDIDENSSFDETDLFKKLVILNLKKEISIDELLFISNYVTHSDPEIALISSITLKKYKNLLKLDESKKEDISKIYSSIGIALDNINEINASNAILTSIYLAIIVNPDMPVETSLKLIKNLVTKYVIHENYLISACGLEMLNSFVLLHEDEINLNIEKILENNDTGKLFRKNSLNYYAGIKLLVNLGRYDLLIPEKNPHFDENLVAEYNNLSKSAMFEKIKTLEKDFENKDWLYRFEIGKKIGNLLYACPYEIKYSEDVIKSALNDPVYLVRSVGIWVLQIIAEKDFKIKESLVIEAISGLDDPNMEIRQDCAIFYNKLLRKYPEILKNQEIKYELQSALITKYFTDHFKIVQTMCEDTLKLIPNSGEFIGYKSKSMDERFEILEKVLDTLEFKKPAIIRIKVKLRSYIRSKDDKNILKILKFVEKQDLTEEYFNIIYELCKLKNDFEIANNLLNRLKIKFPEVPKSRENTIYENLSELIISRRIDSLNETFEYMLEDFKISERITNKIKEFVIYPQADLEITELSLKILEKMNTAESTIIVKEKHELENYLLNNKPVPEMVNIKNQNWQEIYHSLTFLLTKDYETLNYVHLEYSDLVKFSILESEKNSLIISIILLDTLINNLKSNDVKLLNEIDDCKKSVLKNLSKIILNEEYPFLSHKGVLLLKTIISKKTSWFKEAALMAENLEEYLPLVSKLLDENTPQIQVESLETLANMVKLNVKCTEYPEIHEKVLKLISNDKKWIIFKKALEVIYSCNFEDDEEMLENVSKQILKYLKTSNDDSKLFLIKFFKIKGIDKIPDYLFEELKEFKNSPNPYVSSEIAELIQKRRMIKIQ